MSGLSPCAYVLGRVKDEFREEQRCIQMRMGMAERRYRFLRFVNPGRLVKYLI